MKKSILIAEDEAIIAKSLKLYLARYGYSILKTVSTGEGAVQSVKRNKPDLILMDVRLRGLMNGYETMAKIRLHSDVPVLYATGGDKDQICDKAKDTKPYDYIIKPFEQDVLVSKIKKLLNEH